VSFQGTSGRRRSSLFLDLGFNSSVPDRPQEQTIVPLVLLGMIPTAMHARPHFAGWQQPHAQQVLPLRNVTFDAVAGTHYLCQLTVAARFVRHLTITVTQEPNRPQNAAKSKVTRRRRFRCVTYGASSDEDVVR